MIRLLHAQFLALFFILSTSATTAKVTVTYFHNDVAGSPMVATDATGNVVWKESYKPYGEKQRNEPASRDGKNKIGFAGSPHDASTGLSYMGARYYNPVIGRFMGVDPVGFQEDNIHSFNRYAYANNNPYKFIDPDGRIAILAAVPAVISALTPIAYAIGTRIAMSSIYRFGMSMAAGEVGLVAPAAVTVGAGVAAKGAANFSRELQAADLGVKGTLQELKGTFALKDGVSSMRIDMIRGEIKNPLEVVGNMANTAKASGATSLRIEGTIANERLSDVLSRRYGLTSSGATDTITIPLR